MIYENPVDTLKAEYEWIQKLRSGLRSTENIMMNKNIENSFQFNVVTAGSLRYVECVSAGDPIGTEQDALDLVAACGGEGTQFLLLHAETLAEGFYSLRTGIAGKILQKFSNYRIKAALLVTDTKFLKGRFSEFTGEAVKSGNFGVFTSRSDAEKWLAT